MVRGDLGEQLVDVATDHQRDQLGRRGLVDAAGVDVGPVAHHGDGVGEGEDLVEAVGDEDERAALVAQAAGDGEETVHLDTAECRGGLVHHEEAGVEGDGLGDLDDLLVGDGEAGGRAAGVDAHPEPGEEALGLGDHRGPVDAATAGQRLAAHEDVLGDRQVGEERRLLVDDRDAGLLGVGGRGEVDGLAAQLEDPGVAAVDTGDDLDQRRLAGAVLADEGVDRTTVDPQAAGPQGHHRAERLRDVAQLEHRGGGGAGGHRNSSD